MPYGESILAAAANCIVERCTHRLPLLNQVVVLVPDLQQGPRLRRALMTAAAAAGYDTLLGPRIETFASYLANLPLGAPAILPDDARELVLLEALRHHADLFGDADLWRVARGLLELFDQLNLQQASLPSDLAQFRQLLHRAYGVEGAAPSHLSREAEIVHTLWRAWHQQLEAEHAVDRNTWYLGALGASLRSIDADNCFFAIGYSELRPAESAWLERLIQRGQAEVILHGKLGGHGYHPDAPLQVLVQQLRAPLSENVAASPRSEALSAAFDIDAGNLQQRAAMLRAAHPHSPLAGRLGVFAAADSEQEARAVELQIRQWLLAGKRRIGIVTEDRRLARRIRALLERAGILLSDSGGWALSTTSSATVIERWLQAVEEDFAHQPMMDLLKSPFLLPDDPDQAATYRRAIYRLEQDIVLHENIPRGLDRFRKHLQYRQRRLGWSPQAGAAVHALLDRLAHAAEPLSGMVRGRERPLSHFVAALLESLERLGVLHPLEGDAAGAQVIQQLERLQQAARYRPLTADWFAFRSWLGAALERSHYRPTGGNARVQLLSLEQCTLVEFEGLLLAAAEHEFLPGRPDVSPYFNDGVRRELGLRGWRERLALRLHHFRRVLESAPQVVVTYRREQDGEELLPSPWLEAIQSLHELAYDDDLSERNLGELLADERSQVQSPDQAPLPAPAGNPHAPVPAARIPQTISVAAHQHLLDCPYQFFAADCLRLKPVEEIREALEKSDYGERVHRCLEAFHGGVSGLPGPFAPRLQADNRDEAVALLREISDAVFARDLEDNFIHRGWLKRWLAMIPDYIDWQLHRERQWQPTQIERSLERPLTGLWRLRGRLDRVDRNDDDRRAVVDYKTGAIPTPEQVTFGEAVQLVSYAMLLDDVDQVEYLQLDKQIKSTARLEGETLTTLRDSVRARLIEILDALAAGTGLPAWGDPATCAHCQMAGLCRRQTWDGPIR